MRKKLTTVLLLLVMFTGLSLLLYPTVSDYWNSYHQSRAIAAYTEGVSQMDAAEYGSMMEDAEAYNSRLLEKKENRYRLTEAEEEEYNSLLDVTGTGIMGYVEIPKLKMSLPIYHGTEDTVLQIAVGHLEGSSLPVGGSGTHCVLTGHRRLPSAKLLSNLDEMEEGDTFSIHVLDRTLTYQVDQIRIVEPREVEDLEIEEGKDYCTLLTCTPYGINSHILLVRGYRIANAVSAQRIPADAVQIDIVIVVLAVAVVILLAGGILWFLVRRIYERKGGR